MFTIGKTASPIGAELLAKMTRTETATIGHFRHHGFADPAIESILIDTHVAGSAVTVRIPGADSTLLHYALSLCGPGDVLVIDRCGDTRHACWGGVVTAAAKLANITAAIIDGPATDIAEVRAAQFPLWCRGRSSMTTKFLEFESAVNIPVSFGGVIVSPGDGVIADYNGIAIVPRPDIEGVCDAALAMQENELRVLDRLRRGEKLADISGAAARVANALANGSAASPPPSTAK